MKERTCGVSIAELLVSLVILALGATLSIRVLSQASRGLEEAELSLRAVIYLSELSAIPVTARAGSSSARPAGPGWLTPFGETE